MQYLTRKLLLRIIVLVCSCLFWGNAWSFGVTINQAATQPDPTRTSLLVFDVVFASPVTGGSFECSDISLSGTGGASCFLVTEQAPGATNYQVLVTGLQDGTISASIPSGGITSGVMSNDASTSVDATILLDTAPPISAAVVSSPSQIGNNLNAPLAGSCGIDAANGRVIIETSSGTGFTPYPATSALDGMGGFSIPVTWQEGSFAPRVSCYDVLDNGPTVTIASDFPAALLLDVTRPDVVINHVGDDPTQNPSISFSIAPSESVNTINCSHIDLSLSTTVSVICDEIISHPSGVFIAKLIATGTGTVIAFIAENSFTDLAGNLNTASTSTDNQVEFFDFNQAITVNVGDGVVVDGTQVDLMSILVTDSNGDNVCNAVFSGNTWSCTSSVNNIPGDGETITATGTDMFGGVFAESVEINSLLSNPDKDRDGIPDRVELYADTDGDGIDDHFDIDSDNDGIPDVVEAGDYRDADGDNISDRFDVDITEKFDSNNDGIDDAALFDQDNDGLPDFRDRDADNDGLPDRSEAGLSLLDTDSDGIDDVFDITQTSGADINNDGIDDSAVAKNTDGRKLPDHLTADSDDDGLSDSIESNIILSGGDTDGDGIDNAVDADIDGNGLDAGKIDANGDGVDDRVDVDTDADGILDRFDLDSDNDSYLDAIEASVVDANSDGFIDDGQALVITPLNSDADSDADYRDGDKENDSIQDISLSIFSVADTDGDGRAELTVDTDNDGIMLPIDQAPNVYGNLSSATSGGGFGAARCHRYGQRWRLASRLH